MAGSANNCWPSDGHGFPYSGCPEGKIQCTGNTTAWESNWNPINGCPGLTMSGKGTQVFPEGITAGGKGIKEIGTCVCMAFNGCAEYFADPGCGGVGTIWYVTCEAGQECYCKTDVCTSVWQPAWL